MTPEQRRARGIAARVLIDDQTINDAFDEIENDIRTAWENSSTSWGAWFTRRKRERLWIELRTVKALRQRLASFAGQAPRD